MTADESDYVIIVAAAAKSIDSLRLSSIVKHELRLIIADVLL